MGDPARAGHGRGVRPGFEWHAEPRVYTRDFFVLVRCRPVRMNGVQLRDEALLMLEGRGAILDVARTVSRLLVDRGIDGAVIGGVAVTLHGHVRATSDVDVYVPDPLAAFADHLAAAGCAFDAARREFTLGGVPIHLVPPAQAKPTPTRRVDIDDVRTVSLADLINLKLFSGIGNLTRTRDLADVVDLVRVNGLDGRFVPRIAKPLRDEFRRIAKAVRAEQNRPPPADPFSHSG